MNTKGYTLMELMLLVAIIGILAAILMSRAANAIRSAHESTTKGNLVTLRIAIAAYAADHDGIPPTDNLQSLVAAGYLRSIPLKSTPPYHPDGNTVSVGNSALQPTSRGDWFYVNDPADPLFGTLVVNCEHLDLKGRVWLSY